MNQAAIGNDQSSTPEVMSTTTGLAQSEFLTFKLGHEEYGMDIMRVQEIRSYERPTHMANSPAHILGVINLRGVIVPIVDMRIKFNLTPVHYAEFTVVIVVNLGRQVVGVVVDGVSDVITFKPEQLRAVPEFTSVINHEYMLSIGSLENRMLMLLDIQKLLQSADMGLLANQVH